MHAFRSIVIFLEDAPAAPQRASTGLSKALIPMVKELAPHVAHLEIVQTHAWLAEKDILNLGIPSTKLASRWHRLIAWLASRLSWPFAVLLADVHGKWLGWRMRSALNQCKKIDAIWGAVGIDPLTCVRLHACARAAGLPFELYLVDDIETHPANRALHGIGKELGKILQCASRIYTITPELGDRLEKLYGVRATHLPLSADCPDDSSTFQDPPQYFGAYLGSINHLYESGLQLLVAHTAELRSATGSDLQLRIITQREDVAKTLGGDEKIPEWVICGSVDSQENLGKVLKNSRFCYLPYSFDSSAQIMASSSFPSKLLDYLAWARYIVVYAPKGSVPYNFFVRQGLDFVTDDEDNLHKCLEKLAHSEINHSVQCRAALMEEHGPGRATVVVLEQDQNSYIHSLT